MTAINDAGRPQRARPGRTWMPAARTIQAKLTVGFALGPVILLVIGAISYSAISGLVDARDRQQHAYQVLVQAEAIAKVLVDAETGQRGYLITGADVYLAPYRDAVAKLSGGLDRLAGLAAAEPRQQARIETLRKLVQQKLAELKETIAARKDKGPVAAAAIVETGAGKEYMDKIRGVLDRFEGEESEALAQRNAALDGLSRFALQAITWGTLACFLLLAAVGFWFGRSIVVPIKGTIAALGSAAVQILAGTSEQVSATAEEAAAVKETAVTVAEVKQTADLAMQRAKAVGESADRVARTVSDGERSIADGIQGSQEAKARMEALAGRILALSEQANAIAELNAAVNDLAEQSNLLAVNASIEAAKAGEAGKGFAVVAGEVRALAEQSKQATAQVRTILVDIQRATQAAVLAAEQGVKSAEAGVAITGRSGEAIRQLSETVAESGRAAQQILAASRQQTVGMEQVDLAMRNIEQSSTQTAAATRQVQSAARNLNDLARRLAALVGDRAAEHGL